MGIDFTERCHALFNRVVVMPAEFIRNKKGITCRRYTK